MPKISIITINYNDSKGLEKTINSIVNQTFQDFEYIIIDGGSSDESLDVIKRHEDGIHYWISEEDAGIYNAMNKGIRVANGDYLLFLNSGDHLFNKNVLLKNIEHFNNEDIIYFNVEIRGNNNSKIVSYPDKLSFFYFFLNGLCHQAVFIRRELFYKYGFYDEELKIVSDWKFFLLTIFKYNSTYKKMNKILSTHYLGGVSTQIDNTEERNIVLNQHFSGFVEDYRFFFINYNLMKSNRFKMLREIEKSIIGAKLVSFFFRIYIVLFTKKRLKDLLKTSQNQKGQNE